MRHKGYALWASGLVLTAALTARAGDDAARTLIDRAVKAHGGEANLAKRPARGVTVSSKGRRDVNLYFDKVSGLLVKSECRVEDDNGQEVTEETLLDDYKEVQGTKQAMKLTIKRDGNLYLECEITECRL